MLKRLAIAVAMLLVGMVAQAQVTITNMYVSASTNSTATIVWTTNVAASSQLKYGTDASLPYANNTNYTLTTSHSMTLTLLSPAYLYYVAAVSTDNAGHTTQSSTINFGLCGQPFVPTSGTVNNYYEYGSFTMTWQPPAGSSGTPTVCGLPMNTTITGALSGGASLSAEVPDAYRVIPGPGTWQVRVTDAGNLSPITITNPISATSNDLSAQLQAAAPAAGLTAVIANTVTHGVYPSFICTTFTGCGSANAITALTGDGTATGPGSVPFTLATVNGSPGSCGDSTHVGVATINGKGLTTACSATAIAGYTIGTTTYAPGSNIQSLAFMPGSGNLPVINITGLSAGSTSGYIHLSANTFQWNAIDLIATNGPPEKHLIWAVSNGLPQFNMQTSVGFGFLNCSDAGSGSCTDGVSFSKYGTSTVQYGSITPVSSLFTTPWTLGSLVLTNIGTSPSTSPICPNGTGGILTTSGCVIGSSGLSGMTTGQVAIAGSATTITSSIALGTSGATIPLLNGSNTASGANIFSANGVASTPSVSLTGTWFTGGSSTTTKPQFLIEPVGTTSTGWSTNGTGIGVNGTASNANSLDLQLNGVSKFAVNGIGVITQSGVAGTNNWFASTAFNAGVNFPAIGTATSSANFGSNLYQMTGSYWTGSVAANDVWQINPILGTGANPISTFVFAHSGSTGVASVSVPGITFSTTTTVTLLPSCSSLIKGVATAVTDALAPTYLGTLTGGSSTYAPVICNGTAWVSY